MLKQDLAGVGGDVNYLRTTVDTKTFYEVIPDLVGVLHVQGGYIAGWGTNGLRMLDHFQMGPNLVRGFAPSGIGPRDLTQFNFNGTPGDALGGSMYWGASVEFQSPIPGYMPRDGVRLPPRLPTPARSGDKGPLVASVRPGGNRRNSDPVERQHHVHQFSQWCRLACCGRPRSDRVAVRLGGT